MPGALKVWNGTAWVTTAAAVLNSDTGWLDLGLVAGFTKSGTARARQIGSQVYIEIQAIQNAAALTVSANGTVTDTPVATLPVEVGNPGVTQRVAGWAAGRPASFAITTAGSISITAADGYGTATTIQINGSLQMTYGYAV